ncbi:acyltransferase family protein [Vibrio sp. 10N.222.51.C12]|uniref:acyltransferase family protein n=1 Tax=Vibrio sp. 10N.222.51.C12 TaxID=3229622 RepID=UPI00354B207B
MSRQSNFELLRILAMFLIVAHHYSVHGGWNYPIGFEIHKFYAQSLSIGGKLGVNFFVLISGYFLCKSKFKWDAITGTIAKTWFYSIAIMLIFLLSGIGEVTPKTIIKSLLPFDYWFVNTFICMLILSPFINTLLNNLDKGNHLKLIILLCVFIWVPPLNKSVGHLSLFVCLYCTGSFLRTYYEEKRIPNRFFFTLIPIGVALLLTSIAAIDYLSSFNINIIDPLYFTGNKSPLTFLLSIVIFIYFKQINIGSIKSINIVSSTMFGVYLIHDHQFVRPFLWHHLFKNDTYLDSNLLYIHSISAIIAVFVACIVLDLIRSKVVAVLNLGFFQRKLNHHLNKVSI